MITTLNIIEWELHLGFIQRYVMISSFDDRKLLVNFVNAFIDIAMSRFIKFRSFPFLVVHFTVFLPSFIWNFNGTLFFELIKNQFFEFYFLNLFVFRFHMLLAALGHLWYVVCLFFGYYWTWYCWLYYIGFWII